MDFFLHNIGFSLHLLFFFYSIHIRLGIADMES